MGKGLGHVLLADLAVCSGIDQNAVFAVLCDLNDGVTAFFRALLDPIGIHPVLAEKLQKKIPVRTHAACVENRESRLGQGNGLIQPLAPGEDRKGFGRLGLALGDDVIQGVNVIDVAGAVV